VAVESEKSRCPEDVAREVKSFIGDMRMQLSLYKYQY
jgi:hypothetical protein